MGKLTKLLAHINNAIGVRINEFCLKSRCDLPNPKIFIFINAHLGHIILLLFIQQDIIGCILKLITVQLAFNLTSFFCDPDPKPKNSRQPHMPKKTERAQMGMLCLRRIEITQ